MKILSAFAIAGVLSFPFAVNAKRVHNKLTSCTFLYGSREKAMKELVRSWDTLHFAPGEHIADIGAKGANMAGILSMFCKNLDITLEDIDSACLNDRQVSFVLDYYAGINDGKQPQGINCHVVIGNDTSTTLPDATYRKVFFINTYHEVTKPRQMLADIHRILAPGGMLYMQEQVAGSRQLRRKDCGHIMPVESELLKALAGAGFRLIKTNVTERHKRKGDVVRWCWYRFQKV